MTGMFGYSAQNLEMQVQALTQIVDGLMDLVLPGVKVEAVDPYTGWVQLSGPNLMGGRNSTGGQNFADALANLKRMTQLPELPP